MVWTRVSEILILVNIGSDEGRILQNYYVVTSEFILVSVKMLFISYASVLG
jgi:hypothetical protein